MQSLNWELSADLEVPQVVTRDKKRVNELRSKARLVLGRGQKHE